MTKRDRDRQDRALDVLHVLRPDRPAMCIGEIAECALGINTETRRRQARKAIDYIIYEFHIRVRRRRPGQGLATVYWIEQADAAEWHKAIRQMRTPEPRAGQRPAEVLRRKE